MNRFSILLTGLFLVAACSDSKFKGSGKQASMDAAACPKGVEEVRPPMPEEVRQCWQGGHLYKTSGGAGCSGIETIVPGCETPEAAKALAVQKVSVEAGDTVANMVRDGGKLVGCGFWAANKVFFMQVEHYKLDPSKSSECKKIYNPSLFSYCVYAGDSPSPEKNSNKCVWP